MIEQEEPRPADQKDIDTNKDQPKPLPPHTFGQFVIPKDVVVKKWDIKR